MATPRKHWFRVADGVLNKAWTNNELAALVRLMAYLNTRWARSGLEPDEACEADIPTVAVMQITGRGRADVARSSLERLAVLAEIFVEIKPEVCSIKWPNWAEFQELRSRKCPENARESPCPQTHTQTHTQEEEKKESAADAAPSARKAKSPRPDPADWSLETSDLLIELLDPVPGAVIPRGARASWAREMERLVRECPELRTNGADPATHIAGAIRWALGPQNLGAEYEVVIRSGRALREKWPTLRAASRRVEAKRQPTPEEFQQQIMDKIHERTHGTG